MAHKIITSLIDDIDGTEAIETITFMVDGKSYEIDLSADNAAKIREDFGRWIEHARRPTPGGRGRGGRSTSSRRADLHEIRVWAQENGIAVSNRGRVPQSVVDQYDKAR